MTKINEFDEKEFTSGVGLPDGDTFINLEVADFEKTEQDFEGKITIKYIYRENDNEYYLPKGLMADIKKISDKGSTKVRVTRTGEGMDTRYTAVAVIE